MIRIVTDRGVDMPPEWQDKYSIHAIPLYVRFGDKSYMDGVDLTREQFYQLIDSTRQVPKTSLPGPSQVVEFYRQIAEPGDTILSLHISSKVSGTYSVVKTAAEEVKDTYDVHVIDTLTGSAAMGYMAREASLMAASGSPLDQIIKRMLHVRELLTVHLALDSLEYAHLNGRISALKALVSSVLKVKPVIAVIDGELGIADKVRTRARALDKMLELASRKVKDMPVRVGLVHANALDTAESMRESDMRTFNVKELIVTDLTVPIVANLGPGTIGFVTYPAN